MKHIIIIALLLLASCSTEPTDIFDDKNNDNTMDQRASKITELKSLYQGSTQQIIEDITIEVLSLQMMFGEYLNRLFIQDDSGGIEIFVDDRILFENYRLYYRIKLF